MNCKSLVGYGKSAYKYVARKGKSAYRQISYLTEPIECRANVTRDRKISEEVLNRFDKYQEHLVRNGKIIKAVRYISEKSSQACEAFNNIPLVKSTKETARKVGNFINRWFGDGGEPQVTQKLKTWKEVKNSLK